MLLQTNIWNFQVGYKRNPITSKFKHFVNSTHWTKKCKKETRNNINLFRSCIISTRSMRFFTLEMLKFLVPFDYTNTMCHVIVNIVFVYRRSELYLICQIMVPTVPNGTNVKVEWYQWIYSERSHYVAHASSRHFIQPN